VTGQGRSPERTDAGSGPANKLLLTLLSRAYCHLCDEMRVAVAPIAAAHGATLSVVDVDADQTLEAVYGDRVPVLFLGAPGSGIELGHYVCDTTHVSAALAAAASAADRG
jgi:hypothetical protein